MGKDKKTPKKKTVSVKDLSPKSGKDATGGRQTPKTDFGAVLGQGISKAADISPQRT